MMSSDLYGQVFGDFGGIIPSMSASIPKFIPRSKSPKFPIGKIRKMEGAELERYLRDFSVEEIRQSRALWAELARRPSLILFEANENKIRL